MKYWVLDKNGYNSAINLQDNILTITNGIATRIIDVKIGTIFYGKDDNLLEDTVSDIQLIIDDKKIDFYNEFTFKDYNFTSPNKDIDYVKQFNTSSLATYPPQGKAVELNYTKDNLKVTVIYEIFDGIPVICKRVYIYNYTGKDIIVNKYVSDNLLISQDNYIKMYAETNYNGGCMLNNNRTQSVQYINGTMQVGFDLGPDAVIKSEEVFTGLRVYELLHTATYYEQKLIEVKEMYRIICPWVLESPLIFHITSDRKRRLINAINDIKEVGFDMLIQSFGSGINVENNSKRNIIKHRKIYDYAHSQGIKIGGYTLAIVKNYKKVRGKEANPLPDKSGIMRCLATEWSVKYWKNILKFYDRTLADCIEIDGPYHFYECNGGQTHLHKGLSDSKYMQWKLSNEDIYKQFKKRNIYINAPDWMYLNGVNKCGIGYEEIAFSEPRQHQLISSRIYNYKGTFAKIPSMGWGFLPIDIYHGGGKQACFSPLEENYKDYDWMVFQHIVQGVIPCFRGKRLFDGEKSKEIICKWARFYKKYQSVINGITVHFMPPIISEKDRGRTKGLDCIFNCTTQGETRGILAVFNQTERKITEQIAVPIFYTNLTKCDYIPSPRVGSGITDVVNPIYGEYPPAFPIKDESNSYEAKKVTGYGKTHIINEKIEYQEIKPTIIGQINALEREQVAIKVNYDSNGDAMFNITLDPMSYTYFIIKE